MIDRSSEHEQTIYLWITCIIYVSILVLKFRVSIGDFGVWVSFSGKSDKKKKCVVIVGHKKSSCRMIALQMKIYYLRFLVFGNLIRFNFYVFAQKFFISRFAWKTKERKKRVSSNLPEMHKRQILIAPNSI